MLNQKLQQRLIQKLSPQQVLVMRLLQYRLMEHLNWASVPSYFLMLEYQSQVKMGYSQLFAMNYFQVSDY